MADGAFVSGGLRAVVPAAVEERQCGQCRGGGPDR